MYLLALVTIIGGFAVGNVRWQGISGLPLDGDVRRSEEFLPNQKQSLIELQACRASVVYTEQLVEEKNLYFAVFTRSPFFSNFT